MCLSVYASVCWSHWQALQEWLNWLRCHLGADLHGPKELCIRLLMGTSGWIKLNDLCSVAVLAVNCTGVAICCIVHATFSVTIYRLPVHGMNCTVAGQLSAVEALHWESPSTSDGTACLWQHGQVASDPADCKVYQCVEWAAWRDNYWIWKQYAQVER